MAEPASPEPSTSAEADPKHEAIRRGVQYLAFRLTDQGLAVSYQPGATAAPVPVMRAALAAVAADTALAAGAETARSPLEQRAWRERAALAEQLAQVRARRPEALRIAWRERYLATLAQLMLAQAKDQDRPDLRAGAEAAQPRPQVAARRANF